MNTKTKNPSAAKKVDAAKKAEAARKKQEKYFAELRQKYPKTMSKDQFYQVAHISKSTALYLLTSGLVPCKDTGKKTRRYTIKTEDVLHYLIDRRLHPLKYKASPGWYIGTAGNPNPEIQEPAPPSVHDLNMTERRMYRTYLEQELSDKDDLITVADVSEFTGYSRTAIFRWCRKGYLKYFEIGNKFLIPKSEFIEYLLSSRFDRISIRSTEHQLLLCDFFEEIGK